MLDDAAAAVFKLVPRRHDLAPLLARTVKRLHIEGARAHADIRTRRSWPLADERTIRARSARTRSG